MHVSAIVGMLIRSRVAFSFTRSDDALGNVTRRGVRLDFLKVYEGHYDMKMSTKALKRRATRWNIDNQAVLSWTLVMRRKKEM